VYEPVADIVNEYVCIIWGGGQTFGEGAHLYIILIYLLFRNPNGITWGDQPFIWSGHGPWTPQVTH